MEIWGYYSFEGRTCLGRSNQEDQVIGKTGMKTQGYASGRWKEKRVMAKLPPGSIRVREVRDIPHTNPHAARFSHRYLESRPWKSSPNDLRSGRVPPRN